MRCNATPGWAVGAVLLAIVWGCGPSESVFQQPGEHQALIFPEEDYEPPRFAGISSLEQVGPRDFRVRWEPARDNVTSPDRIRYRVVTQAQGFRVGDEPQLVVESDPGETEVRFRGGPYAWPLHVIAIDEAGNASALGPGLRVAPQPRLLQVETGLPVEPLHQCAALGAGEMLCTGGAGSVLRFRRDRWVDHGRQAPGTLWVSLGGGEAWLWSEDGFLLRFDNEVLTPGGLMLQGGETQGDRPLVSLTREPGGLWVWRDERGNVWWGVPPVLRFVQTPVLHRMDYACQRPPLIGWTRHGGIALCEDGAVLQQDAAEGSLLWEALTVQADVDAPGSLLQALDSPGELGTLVTRTAILQPRPGPWRTILRLPDGEEIRGVYAPDQGPVIVATTDGLWAFAGQSPARRIRSGAFVGVGPAPVLRSQWQWVAIDSEAREHPGSADRVFEPVPARVTRLRLQGWDADQRPLVMAEDGRVLRPNDTALEPEGARWEGPPPTGFARSSEATIVVGGAGRAWASRRGAGAWSEMRFLTAAAGTDGALDFEPLLDKAPADLVEASRRGTQVQPLRGVHAHGSLAVAWGQDQAWLLHPSGDWVLGARTETPILHAAAVGGNRWMVWTEAGLLRCADDTCSAPEARDAHGTTGWRSAWLDAGALCAMGDAPLLVACAPLDADVSFEVVTGFPPDLNEAVVASARGEGGTWLLTDAGVLLGQDLAEVPMPIGEVVEGIGLLAGQDGGLQVLTRRAWLRQEPAPVARRQD